MSDKRAKVENKLRKERLSAVGEDISDLFHGHIEKEKLFNRFTNQTSIETLARVELLKSHKNAYSKLLNILRSLTANFSEDVIEIHHDTAEVIIELLRGDKNWSSLDVKQMQSILRDEDLVGIIDEGAVLACILTDRVINCGALPHGRVGGGLSTTVPSSNRTYGFPVCGSPLALPHCKE